MPIRVLRLLGGIAPRGLLAVIAMVGFGMASAQSATRATLVHTTEGPVRGVVDAGIAQYLGIPYAAPPTGQRRWTLPAAPARHAQTLVADHFREACPQVVRFNLTEASDAEDCLFLNIAVPSARATDGRPRAVLFWIHGGAYVGGGANLYRIDHLARQGDLVVVSINYRLGALGFLAHPQLRGAASGAFGIADQQAALRWVHRNIARFGGDPKRVTIAGESAGAGSVCALLATPERVAGLYAGAIIQSAGCGNPWMSVLEAEEVGRRFAQAVGCTAGESLECLRGVALAQVLAVQTQMAQTGARVWVPAVGSAVLPREPTAAVKVGLIRVPVINGGTRDEMRLYLGYEVVAGHPYTAAEYAGRLEQSYGSQTPAVLAQYPLSEYSSPSTAVGTALSDYGPMVPLSNCTYLRFGRELRAHTAVYEYEFADRGAPPVMDDPGIELGAVHSAELPYFFPGFSNRSDWQGPALAPQSQHLSDDLIALWAGFARTGVPQAAHRPTWPRFTGPGDVYRFDAGSLGTFDADSSHRCGFWRSLYPQAL